MEQNKAMKDLVNDLSMVVDGAICIVHGAQSLADLEKTRFFRKLNSTTTQEQKMLAVDLSKTDAAADCDLKPLLNLKQRVEDGNCVLQLRNPTRVMRKVFSLTKSDWLFDIESQRS
jgi:anti-anti-sigma regulatory factor